MTLDLQLFSNKLSRYCKQYLVEIHELALETGIELSRLKSLIDGKCEPTGDEILIIADYFKCDFKFFISNEKLAPFEETEELFRKHGEEFVKEDRNNIKDFLFLCECEYFLEKELNRNNTYSFFFEKKGNYLKAQGVEAARKLRNYLKFTEYEVPRNIIEDFRKLGVHIFRRKLGKSSISGVYIHHPLVGHCILVNYDEDIFRQRFSVAHEMGHVILDDERVSISISEQTASSLIEVRANTFASHYLLPDGLLKKISSTIWTEETILDFSKKLFVNPITLSIRLFDCNLITKEEKIRFSKLKINKVEKEEYEISHNESKNNQYRKVYFLQKGLSDYYVNICFSAYRESIISLGRLKEILLCQDDFEIFEMCKLYNQRIEYGY